MILKKIIDEIFILCTF